MNNLWCTNYSSVRTNTRFTVCCICSNIIVTDKAVIKNLMRSVVAPWLSASFEIEGLLVRASPETLRCVLEQDTLSSA